MVKYRAELVIIVVTVGIQITFEQDLDCKDKVPNCIEQLRLGDYCNHNVAFIKQFFHEQCPKSCGLCDCTDTSSMCHKYATPKRCKKDPLILKLCPKTCCACEEEKSVCLTIQGLKALLDKDFPAKGIPFPRIDGPRAHEKVCIIGAGPAGIDMAVRLKDKGFKNLTLFEKTGRVGGKCHDTVIDGFYRPQGAALLTTDYFDNLVRLARRYNVGYLHPIQYSGVWSKNSGHNPKNKLSIPQFLMENLMKMTNDTSLEFNTHVFLDSIIRYAKLCYSLFGKHKGELMLQPSENTLKQISGTFKEFLEKNNLSPLIPLFQMTQTSLGYGYLDEIGVLYGILWNTPRFLLSYGLNILGVRRDPYQIYILKGGFEKIWKTIVEKEMFDIRYNTNIRNIDRNGDNVVLDSEISGSKVGKEKCDFLIWTPPMPELINRLSSPSDEERELFSTLSPHVLLSTLIKELDIIRNRPITFYPETVDEKIDGGITADMNLEDEFNYCEANCSSTINDYSQERGSERILSVVQLQREASSEAESNEIIMKHYQKGFGASRIEFINTKSWDYFYKWTPEELGKGYHWKVFNIQGLQRTWYAGASVSFESVKSVLEYNELLLDQMRE